MAQRALLIGSPVYGLQAVAADLDAMTAVMQRRGFSCRSCYGTDATRRGILAAYESLIGDTGAADAAVVYFAGHGGLAFSGEDGTVAGQSVRCCQFIVPWDIDETTPHDFRGITSLELSFLLGRLTSRTMNVTSIFDCCHAAGMARSLGGGAGVGRLTPRSLPKLWVDGVRHHLDVLRGQGLAVDHLDALGNPHAVRLVATSATQLAYEHSDESGNARGLLTWAFCTALDESGERLVSWRDLTDRVRRLVQSRAYSQRPEVEGPSGRVVFEVKEAPSAGGVPLTMAEGEVFLGCGRIHGVEVGDLYSVLAPSASGGEPRPVAECLVRWAEAARSIVEVRFIDGHTSFPQGAPPHAVPVRLVGRTWSLEVRGETPPMQRLRDAIRATPLLRVWDTSDADSPLAVVSESDGSLVIRDPIGLDVAQSRSSGPGARLAEAVEQLRQLARARTVATMQGGEGDYALLLPFAVEWGIVIDGRRVPPPGRDIPLRVGEHVYVAVRNLSGRALFIHFFDVGVAASVTLLNRSHPSGVELQPGEEYALGTTVDGRLTGLPLHWPKAFSLEGPRDETVVILAMDRPCMFDSMEQVGIRGERGLSGRDPILAALLSGRGTRDLGTVGREPDIRYAVSPITFSLTPVP
jgi:hypothetical protein